MNSTVVIMACVGPNPVRMDSPHIFESACMPEVLLFSAICGKSRNGAKKETGNSNGMGSIASNSSIHL